MSYRSAFLLLLGVFLLQFSRVLFQGEVIFPHDNSVELGAPANDVSTRISNRKFSDESSVFIPELANNLGIDRKGWLTTWNPHVQLGRPSFQGSLSRAFLLTNLLSYLTSNPFVLYTILVLLTVGLTACFMLLFLRSLGLHPAACLIAALGLAFTTATSYWLCFVMFVSAICWPVCLLWLITEFVRKPSWLIALGLTFATYCLLMTSYPQVTVLSTYLVGFYTLLRLGLAPATLKAKGWILLALLACALAGILAALPVLLDLLFTAKASARVSGVSDSFFLAILPSPHSAKELVDFLTTIFDWSWLGNSIDPKYPLAFNGMSFTPFYGTLIWLSFLLKNKRDLLFWQLFLIVCLAETLFPGGYLFAVHHLGFGLSRIQLTIGGIIPGFVLSAFVVDAVLRAKLRLNIKTALWLLAPVAVELVVALLAWHQLSIDKVAVVITFLLVVALGFCLFRRNVALVAAAAIVSTFFYGRELILSRPVPAIHTSSRLVDAIKAHTSHGERFAIADTAIAALPPNEEGLVNLTSVDSYDSLSSRRYQKLVEKWSAAGTSTYGRYFRFMDAKRAFADPDFPLSDVRVLLSAQPLEDNRLKLADELGDIKLYEMVGQQAGVFQTADFEISKTGEVAMDPSSATAALQSHRVAVLNDFQKIDLTVSPKQTMLFLSQQFHRSWRANSPDGSLRTVLVNGFYQGVLIPPNTRSVELSFRPFVLWSWLPQLVFVGAGIFLCVRFIVGKRRVI